MTEVEEKEFLTLIEENKDRIYRICHAYCIAPMDAQDLFQEVVVQIWQSLGSFKGNSHVKTWIYRITLNVCYRSNKTQKRNNQNIVPLDGIEIAQRQTSVASSMYISIKRVRSLYYHASLR